MSTIENKLNVNDLKLKLQKFDIVDGVILGLPLVISLIIGLYQVSFKRNTTRQNNDVREQIRLNEFKESDISDQNREELHYLVGNRNMKVIPVAMSLISSFISGITIIGLSTEIYMYGILYAYTIPTIIIGGLICWHLFLPVFCDLQITSIFEYFELRYNSKIRLFGSFVNFIGITLWMPMVIYVPGLVINQFTGINIYLIAGIISIVCVFYTCLGGITAVIWTDLFQGSIMLCTMFVIMVQGLINIGGIQELFKINYIGQRIELPEITLDPTVRYSLFVILIGGTISWTETTCCGQVMMQRFLSVSSVNKARKVLIYYIIGITILLCICIFNGLILYAYYHNCDPLTTKLAAIKDQLLPVYIMQIFYNIPGMSGVFMGGILSASLSTLSTCLNSLAAIFLQDFLKKFYTKPLLEFKIKLILKFIVIFFGLLSFILVFFIENLGMIFQLSRVLGSICGGPLFGLFLMGVLMPWINSKSALTGCSISFLFMSWICITAQVLSSDSQEYKPLSVSECSYTFNEYYNETVISIPEESDSYYFKIAHISYLWYTPLGALITILISNIVIIFFGHNKRSQWDNKLIATFLRSTDGIY